MSFCFFLAVLGLHCWVVKIPLVAVRRGYSLAVVSRLLIVVASLIVEHRL